MQLPNVGMEKGNTKLYQRRNDGKCWKIIACVIFSPKDQLIHAIARKLFAETVLHESQL